VFLPGEANDTRGLKALLMELPNGSTVYGDSGYTDYLAEDNIKQTEQITLAILRKKNSRRPDKPWVADLKQHLRHPIETLFSQINQRLSLVYSCCHYGWLFNEDSRFNYSFHFRICFHRLEDD
jgi:hypothetical protein